jgi:transposase
MQRSGVGLEKKLIRRYVNRPAANGPTVAFDEFGPLEIRPQPGQSWQRSARAQRHRATYNRTHGVRHWLAFYDVHADKLWGYVRPRKRRQEVLAVLKRMRRRYRASLRVHLILDNFSPHKTAEVETWCAQNNVHLVWTPTNASWLNPIECEFTPVKEFVIRNSDYADHSQMRRAPDRYSGYRNMHKRKN